MPPLDSVLSLVNLLLQLPLMLLEMSYPSPVLELLQLADGPLAVLYVSSFQSPVLELLQLADGPLQVLPPPSMVNLERAVPPKISLLTL